MSVIEAHAYLSKTGLQYHSISRVERSRLYLDVLDVSLEQFMFQSHVRLRLKANAGAEDVGQSTALLSQSVDHRSTRGGQWSLDESALNPFKMCDLTLSM